VLNKVRKKKKNLFSLFGGFEVSIQFCVISFLYEFSVKNFPRLKVSALFANFEAKNKKNKKK
jgi:hypothetical protein